MPDLSLENLARATGKQADELAHMLGCTACTPSFQCDTNPALVRAALAAYRGRPAPADAPEQSVRVNRRGEVEVGDVEEFRRIRAEHARSAAVGAPELLKDPRKKA